MKYGMLKLSDIRRVLDAFYGHSCCVNERYSNENVCISDRDRFVSRFFRKYVDRYIILMDREVIAYRFKEGFMICEPLCKECAKMLYGFDAEDEHPSIKKIDPYYQLWYRRQKALPIFEAYLHTEIERYKLELKLKEEEKQ